MTTERANTIPFLYLLTYSACLNNLWLLVKSIVASKVMKLSLYWLLMTTCHIIFISNFYCRCFCKFKEMATKTIHTLYFFFFGKTSARTISSNTHTSSYFCRKLILFNLNLRPRLLYIIFQQIFAYLFRGFLSVSAGFFSSTICSNGFWLRQTWPVHCSLLKWTEYS